VINPDCLPPRPIEQGVSRSKVKPHDHAPQRAGFIASRPARASRFPDRVTAIEQPRNATLPIPEGLDLATDLAQAISEQTLESQTGLTAPFTALQQLDVNRPGFSGDRWL
jgi:hypothetical protein